MNEQIAIEGTDAAQEVQRPEEPATAAELSGGIGKISDLRKAEYNPREISEWAKDALRKSMMKFGDLSGIVVNVRSGKLVGGHQRVSLFDSAWRITKQSIVKDEVGTVAEGIVATPYGNWSYREVDWEEPMEMAANIAANKQGGRWNTKKLAELAGRVKGYDDQLLLLTGLDELELKNMGLGELKARTVEDTDFKMKRFLDNDIKQITCYFAGEEYNAVLQRLAAIMKDEKLEDNTAVFLFLLEAHEKNRTPKA